MYIIHMHLYILKRICCNWLYIGLLFRSSFASEFYKIDIKTRGRISIRV